MRTSSKGATTALSFDSSANSSAAIETTSCQGALFSSQAA